VSVDSIKLDLVSAEGSADDVRGYGATIALTSKDGTGTSASADVIVVRLGASIGFYVFVGIGPRNTGVDYSEQTAVVNTVGRVANSFLYRAEAKGLDPTFTVSKGQHRIGEAITFTARTAKQDGFAWNFGDGHMDDGLDKSRSTISHSYRKPGRYTVELAVGLGPSAESKTVLTVLRASHNTPSEKRRRRKPEREPHLPPVTERTSWILAPRPLRPR
jgi:PKD repeat protein